jgi:hypothetical protein
MRMLACYEEILKENKRPLSRQTSVLDFSKSSSGTLLSPPAMLDIGDDPDDRQQFKKSLLLQLSLVRQI